MGKVIDFIKKIINVIVKYIKLFINKIISFIKFIKNKISEYFKNKKQENKQSKIKVFFVSTFAYIGSAFAYLISRPKQKKEVNIEIEIKKIDKTIEKIEKAIENETTPLVLKMYKKEVDKKIKKIKNIDNIKSREDSKLIKEKEEELIVLKNNIEKCEHKLKNIEYKEEKKLEENKVEDIYNIEQIVEKNNKEDKKQEQTKTQKIIEKTKEVTNKVVKKSKNGIKKTASTLKKGALVSGTSIVALTTNIIPKKNKKNTIKNIENKNIKEKIKELNTKVNNIYYEINKDEEKLVSLKEKVNKLKEEYLELTKNEKFKELKNYKDINKIDPNHLIYHGKVFDNLEDYLEKEIRIIKQKEIEKEKEIQRKLEYKNLDIKLAKESINKDIKLSMEDIQKIKVEIANIPSKYKKPKLINKLFNFFKYSINVGLSLIPFGIFKNKALATLTSGIILNNRIRSMNSVINNDQTIKYINYESILLSVENRKTCLENTNYVLLDTVNQIEELKSKINKIKTNDNEKEKLLISLDEMKLDLLEENLKIESMLEEMNDLKVNKVKKKISNNRNGV